MSVCLQSAIQAATSASVEIKNVLEFYKQWKEMGWCSEGHRVGVPFSPPLGTCSVWTKETNIQATLSHEAAAAAATTIRKIPSKIKKKKKKIIKKKNQIWFGTHTDTRHLHPNQTAAHLWRRQLLWEERGNLGTAEAELCPSPSRQGRARDGQSSIFSPLPSPPKACLVSWNGQAASKRGLDLNGTEPAEQTRSPPSLAKKIQRVLSFCLAIWWQENVLFFSLFFPFEWIIFQGFFFPFQFLVFLSINNIKKKKKWSSFGVLDTLPMSERKGDNDAI